jgi:hypothetical protein
MIVSSIVCQHICHDHTVAKIQQYTQLTVYFARICNISAYGWNCEMYEKNDTLQSFSESTEQCEVQEYEQWQLQLEWNHCWHSSEALFQHLHFAPNDHTSWTSVRAHIIQLENLRRGACERLLDGKGAWRIPLLDSSQAFLCHHPCGTPERPRFWESATVQSASAATPKNVTKDSTFASTRILMSTKELYDNYELLLTEQRSSVRLRARELWEGRVAGWARRVGGISGTRGDARKP